MPNKNSSRISVVTVLHNSKAVVGECIKSIPKDVQIYVVDNASNDNGTEIVKEIRPDANIIKSKINLGFGRGNNLALNQITTEYSFIINPDTILNNNTIEELVKTADKYKDAAIIAPIITYKDGKVQKTYKNSLFAKDDNGDNYIPPAGTACAEWILGAAMLLRMDAFKDRDFFDPNIFLFYEDDDICISARRAGHSLIITPDASMTHLCEKSSPATYKYIYRKNWHMTWSRIYIEGKYQGTDAARKLAATRLKAARKNICASLLRLRKKKLCMAVAELNAAKAFLSGKGAFC